MSGAALSNLCFADPFRYASTVKCAGICHGTIPHARLVIWRVLPFVINHRERTNSNRPSNEYDPLSLLRPERRLQTHDESGLGRKAGLSEMRTPFVTVEAILRMHVQQMHQRAVEDSRPHPSTECLRFGFCSCIEGFVRWCSNGARRPPRSQAHERIVSTGRYSSSAP
jgi:hypothetical protein